MDLPAIFDTMLETIPAETPYLAADPEGIALWQRRLKTTRPLKVGLCWRGNPANHDDAERSLPLAALAALMQVPGVSYVAIRQDGEPLPAGWPIQDPAPAVGDMADAAAFLAALDLTITCDTSFAHLAGALALPVWVPLAYSPDWRWMLDRNDTPWYPTMRLFRQSRAGDWETVVREIAKSLQGVVAARISRPGAPRQ
jgi:hypothetical protein